MTHPLSPTAVLPALAILHTYDAARIGGALRALQDLYFPHISPLTPICAVPVLKQSLSGVVQVSRSKRTARLVHHDGVPDSGYASAEEDEMADEEDAEDDDDALDLLRSDALERGYAIQWLTGLVKRGDTWVNGTLDSFPSKEQERRAARLEDGAKLLARFAGDDVPEEALVRTFIFPFRMPARRCRCQTVSSPVSPITIELNDAPVDGTDHTAVGLQSWGSAIVFAERMCLDPERYLGTFDSCACTSNVAGNTRSTMAAAPRRLLELGAGTGLLSMTAAQILFRAAVQGEIKATDYHPSVLENLASNVSRNYAVESVSVERLDWVDGDVCADGFDVVLAADVVYHPQHAWWIRGCVGHTLRKGGVFWLIVPVRTTGRHEGLVETVEAAFPVSGEGCRLAVVGREGIERVKGVGRADERGYKLFEIRWVGV